MEVPPIRNKQTQSYSSFHRTNTRTEHANLLKEFSGGSSTGNVYGRHLHFKLCGISSRQGSLQPEGSYLEAMQCLKQWQYGSAMTLLLTNTVIYSSAAAAARRADAPAPAGSLLPSGPFDNQPWLAVAVLLALVGSGEQRRHVNKALPVSRWVSNPLL